MSRSRRRPSARRAADVLDILGAERDHAADRAGAVDVRGRSAHDIDAADQFRIEEERAIGVVAGALIVLPRAVDHDRDAAEILQAADIDRGGRIVAAILERHAGDIVEDVADAASAAVPWICSSVTTLTGASASIARSSVFDAATVMVSSDCTGARPTWAYAFSTGAARCCRLAVLRFALGLLFPLRRTTGLLRVAVCASAASPISNANDTTDAPKKRARGYHGPVSHNNPNLIYFFGAGWRALRECKRLAGSTVRCETPARICHSWLRGDIGAVNNRNAHFISIVNCSGWIALRPNYTSMDQQNFFGGTTELDGRTFRQTDSATPTATRQILLPQHDPLSCAATGSTAASCLRPNARSSSRTARRPTACG